MSTQKAYITVALRPSGKMVRYHRKSFSLTARLTLANALRRVFSLKGSSSFVVTKQATGSISTPTTVAPHFAASTNEVPRSEEHTSELQSQSNLVCRLLLEKKKN